jgi:hypothetical protein
MWKRILGGVLPAFLLIGLCACGEPVEEEPAVSSAASSARSSVPTEEEEEKNEEDTSSEELTPEPALSWQEAYAAELSDLYESYGRYRVDDIDYVRGVNYAQLADFDEDGTPELLVTYDSTVHLYAAQSGGAVCLWEGNVGARYGQTDVSPTIRVNVTKGAVSLSVYHSESEWTEEAISVVTVEGGVAKVTEFHATGSETDVPTGENLHEFSIDGETVSREDYESALERVQEGGQEIDMAWGSDPASEVMLDALDALLADEGDFLCPMAGYAYLTEADLAQFDSATLRLIRNEIYARHGYPFRVEDLQTYFGAKSWYSVNAALGASSATVQLNACELSNIALIRKLEDAEQQEGENNQTSSDATLESEPISQEAARKIAAEYWDYQEDQTDLEEGELPTNIVELGEMTRTSDGRMFYGFALSWLVDNDHWSTVDWVYVDAETGECLTELSKS